MLKRRVQFCESNWKEGFESVGQTEKGSIKIQFFESCPKRVQLFDSYEKGVQFFESHWKEKSSIFWVILKKVQFFESYEQEGFNSWSLLFFEKKKRFNAKNLKKSLDHIQKKFNSLCHIQQKRLNFFGSYRKIDQFFESYLKRFNYLTHFEKTNSWSHAEKSSIRWVIIQKIQFFVLYLKNKIFES